MQNSVKNSRLSMTSTARAAAMAIALIAGFQFYSKKAHAYTDQEFARAASRIDELPIGAGDHAAYGVFLAQLSQIESWYSDQSGLRKMCADGQFKLDFNASYCDLLSASARHRFSPQQALARTMYVHSGYYLMVNTLLRQGTANDLGLTAAVVMPMISAYQNYPNYIGTVYRGSDLPGEHPERYQVGATISDKGFISTSLDKAFVNSHYQSLDTGWMLTLHSRTCRDLSSYNPSEREILCLPGTKFKITKRDNVKRALELVEL